MDLYFNHAPQKLVHISSYSASPLLTQCFHFHHISLQLFLSLLNFSQATCLFFTRIMLMMMMLMIFTCFCYVSNSRHFQHKRRLHIHNLSHLSQFHFSETTTEREKFVSSCCCCSSTSSINSSLDRSKME